MSKRDLQFVVTYHDCRPRWLTLDECTIRLVDADKLDNLDDAIIGGEVWRLDHLLEGLVDAAMEMVKNASVECEE